jgi:signal transduction histidine kinase
MAEKEKKEIGGNDYLNNNCWLIKNLKYVPYKRCQYCELKFRHCYFLQYQIISLILIIIFFLLFFAIERKFSFLAVITVFSFVIVYGYFFNRSTERIIKSNFSLNKTREALEELTNNLEEKVSEQTNDIKENNIQLEELLKMKSEFLTVASHQLRTPTSITRGYLSILVEDKDKLPAKEKELYLENAWQGINRLERIIHDLLSVTELEGGKYSLDIKPVELTELVSGIVEEIRPLAEEKKLKLVYRKPRELLTVIADENKIREVIKNLVDNAVHYTEEGSVDVFVKAIDSHWLEIKVKDTGIGLSDNDKKHLFGKFMRGEGVLLIHPNGTGLGLYIAKYFVELMKGKVEFKSEGKGKGCIFKIVLPRVN